MKQLTTYITGEQMDELDRISKERGDKARHIRKAIEQYLKEISNDNKEHEEE